MRDELVGYVWGALGDDEQAAVEQILQTDGEARRAVETLRGVLAPLEGDRQYLEAPAGLAARTCQHIRAMGLGSRPSAPEAS